MSQPALRLHVPEPSGRPGFETDFSYLHLSPAGAVRRPPVDTTPSIPTTWPTAWCACSTKTGRPSGPWAPQIEPARLRKGLRAMMKTRIFDARMLMAQRQSKISFYMQSLGEEAIGIAHAHGAASRATCAFPTYRQQGLLLSRDDYPMVDMICQFYRTSATR